MDTNNQDQKLSAIIQQLNSESAARGNAFATLNQRLNALEKLVAEQGDDWSKRHAAQATLISQGADIVAGVAKDNVTFSAKLEGLKEAQSVAALALEVSNIRSVLTQLLEALAEDEDADDGEDGLPDDLSALIGAHDERSAQATREVETMAFLAKTTMRHSLEQVKAAYLAIVKNDADELTLEHIATANVVKYDGEDYRLSNTTAGRSWTIPRDLVAELLAGEDEQ